MPEHGLWALLDSLLYGELLFGHRKQRFTGVTVRCKSPLREVVSISCGYPQKYPANTINANAVRKVFYSHG